jgi:hypothetical protein
MKKKEVIYIYTNLGSMLLHTTNDDNWLIDEKYELILWKLGYIWMKILNDIAWNLNRNSIKLNFNLIELNLN